MKLVTFESEDFYLITALPDWGRGITTDFSLPSYAEAGWDAQESTIATAEKLRLENYVFRTWLEGDEAREVSDGLESRTIERLLVPFWPGYEKTADFQIGPISGGLHMTFELTAEDTITSYVIHRSKNPGGSYNLTTKSHTVPLVICDFSNEPGVALNTDECLDIEFSLKENSDADEALVFSPGALLGIDLDGEERPFLPVLPDWSADPALSYRLVQNKTTTGQGRRLVASYYAAEVRTGMEFTASAFDLIEVCTTLAFLQAVGGVRDRFWVAGGVALGRLRLRGALDADDVIRMDGELTAGETITLVGPEWPPIGAKVVSSVDGLVTLDRTIGEYFADTTSLQSLLSMRLAEPRLEVTWDTDATATFRLSMIEVPASADPSDGAQETIVSLYEFKQAGATIARLTSFERDVDYDGHSFSTDQITHSSISAGLDLDDQTDLTADWRVTPLREFFLGTINRLHVTIRRVELTSGTVLRSFVGEVGPTRNEGRQLTAEVMLLTRDLEARIPRVRFQRPCNYSLFSEGCTLAEGDWTFTGSVAAVADRTVTVTLGTTPATVVQDLFAYGFIAGPGGTRCLIVSSEAASGGSVELTIGGGDVCESIISGAAVTIVPGCDGRGETCKRFGNFANFGGNNVADGNLSLIKVSQSVAGGKK